MIVRAPRPAQGFYVLDKRISEDRRLSWAARGLLVYLLGKPDNWRVLPSALVKEVADSVKPTGRDGTYALLAELIDAGYMRRQQERQADGTHGATRYIVSEDAASSPHTDLPYTAEPHPAGPTLPSIDGEQVLKKEKKKAREVVTWDDALLTFVIPASVMATLQDAYGARCDVGAEIAKAAAWCNTNVTRGPRKDFGRFINSWLARASERAPARLSGAAAPVTRHDRNQRFMEGLFDVADIV